MLPKPSKQRCMASIPRKDSQEVKAGSTSPDKLSYLHECGSKPEHVPLHLKQGTPLADCCWPRDIWKRRQRRGCFPSKSLRLGMLSCWQRGCVGVRGLGMNKPSLNCLPGTETSWESGHRAGKCPRVGHFPIKLQWRLIPGLWGCCQTPRIVLETRRCEASSAPCPLSPAFLIHLSVGWNLLERVSSPSFIRNLLIRCD